MTQNPKSHDGERTVRGIRTVPQPSHEKLNDKQVLDYHHHRKDLLQWCLSIGKNPDKAEGYAEDTIRVRAGHIDRFYRWCWTDQYDGYTTQVTHEDADVYMQHLAFRDDLSKSAASKYQKALKMLWRWRARKIGDDEWEPEITFSTSLNTSQPRDYLTRDERRAIREASLDLSEIPHYKSVYGDERERWKQHLAIRLEKPTDDITKADWEEERSWKEPSIINTSLDAGLRPCEVGRARTQWVDLDNSRLLIPEEDASKERENWVVPIRDETADMLASWLAERECYPRYDDTDQLWLTCRDNPYSSSSLNGLLERVCDAAGISRDVTWYCIRHSTGTYMSDEEGLAAAQSQLRHKSAKTTMKYDQSPEDSRRDALDRM